MTDGEQASVCHRGKAADLMERPAVLFALAVILILGILAFDAITPADSGSVRFAYTLPILLGVYAPSGSSYRLVGGCTPASLVGSFIDPPMRESRSASWPFDAEQHARQPPDIGTPS